MVATLTTTAAPFHVPRKNLPEGVARIRMPSRMSSNLSRDLELASLLLAALLVTMLLSVCQVSNSFILAPSACTMLGSGADARPAQSAGSLWWLA